MCVRRLSRLQLYTLSMLFSRIVAIVAAGLAATPARADLSESGVELRQLSDSNFKASVAKGLW